MTIRIAELRLRNGPLPDAEQTLQLGQSGLVAAPASGMDVIYQYIGSFAPRGCTIKECRQS